ncbi:hypothetical protein [Armatimonas sp.]|uniref:hypothetical protein n=1 Tax=Armatimonas sp. TaxID=1872638 RepID=UPI00286A9AED|nr:hypothetical protein [Armatimonas sp.]
MNASKKIVVTTTVDLDDLEYPIGDINETAATHARAITNDRQMMIRTSRGKIICREIAPNTYLGLTAERRRMSLLQIDENVFIFAPARLPKHRLEHLITHLLTRYGIGGAHPQEPAAAFENFTGTPPRA